jgi:hypothetical protein
MHVDNSLYVPSAPLNVNTGHSEASAGGDQQLDEDQDLLQKHATVEVSLSPGRRTARAGQSIAPPYTRGSVSLPLSLSAFTAVHWIGVALLCSLRHVVTMTRNESGGSLTQIKYEREHHRR